MGLYSPFRDISLPWLFTRCMPVTQMGKYKLELNSHILPEDYAYVKPLKAFNVHYRPVSRRFPPGW